MKTSIEGLQFLRDQEGCVLHSYRDVAGNPTIGVGHLVQEGESFSGTITMDQAMDLLAQDVERFEVAVNDYGLGLSQGQFDALVDFSFNLGEGALAKLLSHGLEEIPNQLPQWCKARVNGELTEVAALVNRRAAEVEMWNS